MRTERILVVGSNGQIGTELVAELRKVHGNANVIASDLKAPESHSSDGPFETLDILDKYHFTDVVKKYEVTQVYLLAALLSAIAEKDHRFAWKLNMKSLQIVLDAALDFKFSKVYWPSSIAVFGPSTPRVLTPQCTITEPTTIYGITKLAGERLCEYYFLKYGLDVRSIRYPGLIGWKSAPGGGTTDYAVHIYHEALRNKSYECFLKADTTLPMMYMPDAIRGTLQLMDAPAEQVKIRSSYNFAGMSFNPYDVAKSIEKHISGFQISYKDTDPRQAIAAGWPESIEDSEARQHWGWKPEFGLDEMTRDMLENLAVAV
ncbi:MAG: NAD-dependent epimerase/dehydratase family protein [Flavobacteriaceae bacterium]|nr:NAD-dependent epimerase/dehydratase family protein [Flavobacteriaceae bacterium]